MGSLAQGIGRGTLAVDQLDGIPVEIVGADARSFVGIRYGKAALECPFTDRCNRSVNAA